jgi:hypothetical protein
MSAVSLRIAPSVLKAALDGVYNDTNISGYTLTLGNTSGTIPGLSVSCDFQAATYNSTTHRAVIQLQAPRYFEVDEGTTITKLNLLATVISPTGTNVLISEQAIETRTYDTNGTYTVSDLIIEIGEN